MLTIFDQNCQAVLAVVSINGLSLLEPKPEKNLMSEYLNILFFSFNISKKLIAVKFI